MSYILITAKKNTFVIPWMQCNQTISFIFTLLCKLKILWIARSQSRTLELYCIHQCIDAKTNRKCILRKNMIAISLTIFFSFLSKDPVIERTPSLSRYCPELWLGFHFSYHLVLLFYYKPWSGFHLFYHLVLLFYYKPWSGFHLSYHLVLLFYYKPWSGFHLSFHIVLLFHIEPWSGFHLSFHLVLIFYSEPWSGFHLSYHLDLLFYSQPWSGFGVE